MPTVGPRYPTGNGATVTGTWTGNATTNLNADDNVDVSTAIATKNATATFDSGNISFTSVEIPTGSSIDVVTLEYEDLVSAGLTTGSQAVTPFLGATTGTAVSHTTSATRTARSADITAQRPGGGAWSSADFTGGTLKVRLTATQPNSTTSTTYNWDYVRVTVTWSTPSGMPDVVMAPHISAGY